MPLVRLALCYYTFVIVIALHHQVALCGNYVAYYHTIVQERIPELVVEFENGSSMRFVGSGASFRGHRNRIPGLGGLSIVIW